MSRGLASRLITIALCVAGALITAPGALAAPRPQLSVSAAILVDPATGQELYGLQANREVAIASTTKLMTALLTLEHVHHLGIRFTQNDWYPASVDSQIGLVPGERMSVHDLLLALMLPSADDAAEDLAYNVGHGSVARFIGMMNARARELGLTRTHYSTPSGLDTPGNYSTAADLVKLAAYDLAHSRFFAGIVALPRAVLHTGSHVRYVTNRNDLVGAVPWIDGVKTGHTSAAGYVLVAAGHRGGMPLISAVLGTSSTQSRDANTLALLRSGFANFRPFRPVVSGQVLARPLIAHQPGRRAVVIASRGFSRVFPRSARLRVRVQVPSRLTGPLRRHAEVGTAVVLAGRRPVARIPLLLARALPAVSSLTIAGQFIAAQAGLLGLAGVLLVVGVGVALRFNGHRRRRSGSGALEAA